MMLDEWLEFMAYFMSTHRNSGQDSTMVDGTQTEKKKKKVVLPVRNLQSKQFNL